MMILSEFQASVAALNDKNGWSEGFKEKDIPEKLALIHSEISEALEEYRNKNDLGGLDDWCHYTKTGSSKPEGFGIELADAIIRILHLAELLGIDMEHMLTLKHEYNKTRPYRHGGKSC